MATLKPETYKGYRIAFFEASSVLGYGDSVIARIKFEGKPYEIYDSKTKKIASDRMRNLIDGLESKERYIATVRVMTVNPDNEDDYRKALEIEFTNDQYDLFSKWLSKNKKVKDFKYEGNAFSIDSIGKTPILEFYRLVKQRVRGSQLDFGMFIGIEWDYWVDD